MQAERAKPLILIGAGGHGKVLAELILEAGIELLGVVERDGRPGKWHFGLRLLGDDATLAGYPPTQVHLAIGIGSLPGQEQRRLVQGRLTAQGYAFPRLIHPRAYVAREVQLAAGVQIMAGAVVQPGCRLDEHVIVNTSASIDHDCHLGSFVHIAPGAVLSGSVQIGERSHVGTGAAIAHGVQVGADAVIGAGASVVRNVAAGMCVIPAALRTQP